MSEHTRIQIADEPKKLNTFISETAEAVKCESRGIAFGLKDALKNLIKMCKEGSYPLDRLQVVVTPLKGLDGIERTLFQNSYTISEIESSLWNNSPEFNFNIFHAESKEGKNLFICHTDSGTAFISEDVSLIQSTIQDFCTNEIIQTLKDQQLSVSIENTKAGKQILAKALTAEEVKVAVEKGKKGEVDFVIDTRKTKRPRCDIMHQLITTKIKQEGKEKSKRIIQRTIMRTTWGKKR